MPMRLSLAAMMPATCVPWDSAGSYMLRPPV